MNPDIFVNILGEGSALRGTRCDFTIEGSELAMRKECERDSIESGYLYFAALEIVFDDYSQGWDVWRCS